MDIPLLLDIPIELLTPRLFLRIPRTGDGQLILPSVRDSLPELKRWMPWAKDEYSLDDSETWCRKSAAEFITRQQLSFAVFVRDSMTHIGNLSAFNFNWKIPSCEVGYWLRTSHTGRGYMSEAVDALTSLLMDKLKCVRVEIRADEGNTRSGRVAERCGFALEGVRRNSARATDGSLTHMRVYSRIAPA